VSEFLFASAFFVTFAAARFSIGWGISALLTFGYLSGVLRANFPGVLTTLMYDAAAGGLYLSLFSVWMASAPPALRPVYGFVGALIAWPTLLLLVPIHHPLIQLVGWRAEAWLTPLILFGTLLKPRDVRRCSGWIAVLNLGALAVGVYLYFRGVEALYPQNAVTEIIYKSRDVAGENLRIPSTFLSAHAYGGTMVLSLPLLLGGLADLQLSTFGKLLRLCGVAAALGGAMLCAAKLPVAVLIVGTFLCWYRSGISLRVFTWAVVAGVVAVAVAASNPRLQRFFDLSDPEIVLGRASISIHEGAADVILQHPLGAGLGAGAPSIPYFLADKAPPPIPVESEYVRLVVDVGWIGLALWLSFVAWLYSRPLRSTSDPRVYWTALFGYGITVAAWLAGLIGIGLLVSIPGSSLLLLNMGLVAQGTVRRSAKGDS
jgi:hypothetical protein